MTEVKKSSPALILVAWLVVSVPAAWGVYNTGKNALKLFAPPAAAPAATPAPK